MDFQWTIFLHLGAVSLALLGATWLRSRVRFFQRFMIPNSLTAGFALLAFYNLAGPGLGLDPQGLGEMIYHLLSLSFIAMSLRATSGTLGGRGIVSTGLVITTSFTLQGAIGLGLTALFIATWFPGLFPSFGLFVPLGFEAGPGQAYSIGVGWEALGFAGAGSIGLTFAAAGFLWACFGGIFLINLGLRKGWIGPKGRREVRAVQGRSGVLPAGASPPAGSRLTTETEAIDSLSVNLATVLVVYLLSYLLLKGLTWLLGLAGAAGRELAVNLWGISFIFAALLALAARWVAVRLRVAHLLDNGSLTRIAGASVDLLVAAALGAISLVVIARFWIPLLLTVLAAGVFTMLYVLWISSRLFTDHPFERAMVIYGASTGTMPTGLALLRVLDPEFRTPAATDYMYGSGISFFMIIPYILGINLPVYAYTRSDVRYYWILVAMIGAYLLVCLVGYRILAGRRAFAHPGELWYRERRNPQGLK
ncbi:MAG: sodium:glutamate symporter [Spirochaetales bacterium]|nr:sodium:glutamate symporter [Spirochaetales bacterium]